MVALWPITIILRERESCQADCNCHSEPAPTLWNSALGRRSFMKKTGSASVAAAIALHGFKLEVLANASGGPCTCGRPKAEVGFFSKRVKIIGPFSVTAMDSAMGYLVNVFDPGNSDQALENSSSSEGFAGPNIPIMEASHYGNTTFLDPATFDVIGPDFSGLQETPIGSGQYICTATIYCTRRNEKVVDCPVYV
jgi:hypothetical protein